MLVADICTKTVVTCAPQDRLLDAARKMRDQAVGAVVVVETREGVVVPVGVVTDRDVVVDAVVRLLPGALGDERSSVEESFSEGRLDWPHYTRPVDWEGRSVPEVLQGGNHAAIRRWRLGQSVARTWVRRPDLIVRDGLSSEESRLLNEFLARREVDDNG